MCKLGGHLRMRLAPLIFLGRMMMIGRLWSMMSGREQFGVKRNSKWSAVRKRFLVDNGSCAVCGGKYKLEVHHIVPYHIAPELELEPSNMVTLCESKFYGVNCHLFVGHLGNFRRCNPSVVSDAKLWKDKLYFACLGISVNSKEMRGLSTRMHLARAAADDTRKKWDVLVSEHGLKSGIEGTGPNIDDIYWPSIDEIMKEDEVEVHYDKDKMDKDLKRIVEGADPVLEDEAETDFSITIDKMEESVKSAEKPAENTLQSVGGVVLKSLGFDIPKRDEK